MPSPGLEKIKRYLYEQAGCCRCNVASSVTVYMLNIFDTTQRAVSLSDSASIINSTNILQIRLHQAVDSSPSVWSVQGSTALTRQNVCVSFILTKMPSVSIVVL